MELKNDYVLGFVICEIFTVIAFQDWVGWGNIYCNLNSQHVEARPELQDGPRFEIFTVKKLQDSALFEIIR